MKHKILIKQLFWIFLLVFTILLSSISIYAENNTINDYKYYDINFMFKDFIEDDILYNSHNIISYYDKQSFNVLNFNLNHYSPNFDGFNRNDLRIMGDYQNNQYKIYINNTQDNTFLLLLEKNNNISFFSVLHDTFNDNNTPFLMMDNFEKIYNVTNGNTYNITFYDDDENILFIDTVDVYYNYLNNKNYELILSFEEDNKDINLIILKIDDSSEDFIIDKIISFYMSPLNSEKFGVFDVWSCPSNTKDFIIIFIIIFLILYLLFLSRISEIFGIMSGIITFLLYFIIGACSPIMFSPLLIIGILLMLYFVIK